MPIDSIIYWSPNRYRFLLKGEAELRFIEANNVYAAIFKIAREHKLSVVKSLTPYIVLFGHKAASLDYISTLLKSEDIDFQPYYNCVARELKEHNK